MSASISGPFEFVYNNLPLLNKKVIVLSNRKKEKKKKEEEENYRGLDKRAIITNQSKLSTGLNVHTATLHHCFKLHDRSNCNSTIRIRATKLNIRRTIHIQIVLPRDPSSHFPLHTPIKPDIEQHSPNILVLFQRHH